MAAPSLLSSRQIAMLNGSFHSGNIGMCPLAKECAIGSRIQKLDTNGDLHGNVGYGFVAGLGGVTAGQFVYISEHNTTLDLPVALPAQADDVATSRDIFYVADTLAAGVQGTMYKRVPDGGEITGNTGAGSVGDPVYLSDTVAGSWTLTEPTGTDHVVQIGTITVDAGAGMGKIGVDLEGTETIEVHDHADNAGGGQLTVVSGGTGPIANASNAGGVNQVVMTDASGNIRVQNASQVDLDVSNANAQLSADGGTLEWANGTFTNIAGGIVDLTGGGNVIYRPIVDGDIAAGAAIDVTKLEAIADNGRVLTTDSGAWAQTDLGGTAGGLLIGSGANTIAVAPMSGEGSLNGLGVFTLTASRIPWTFSTPNTWAFDIDAKHGCLAIGENDPDDTTTYPTDTHAKVYIDNPSGGDNWSNLDSTAGLADFAANYQLYANNASGQRSNSDAVYFGYDLKKFCEIYIDMGGVQANPGGDAWTWEYWDGGAWSALTLTYDHTDTTAQDGKQSFQQDGAICFIPPSDWAKTTADGTNAFWIRARVTTVGNLGNQDPVMNNTVHGIVEPSDDGAVAAPHDGTITRVRTTHLGANIHAADMKFVIVNFTDMACTSEITWPANQRSHYEVVSLDVGISSKLGILVTDEAGGNDPENVAVELQLEYT